MKILRNLLIAASLVLVPALAYATLPTVTPSPSVPQYPINAKLQLSNGTTSGTVIDCTTTGANGSYCANGGILTSIQVTSTDTSNQTLTCNLVNNSVTYILFVITVPLASGTAAGTPPLQVMTYSLWPGLVIDAYGNYLYPISNTDKITCSAGAVTSGKYISIFALGGAF